MRKPAHIVFALAYAASLAACGAENAAPGGMAGATATMAGVGGASGVTGGAAGLSGAGGIGPAGAGGASGGAGGAGGQPMGGQGGDPMAGAGGASGIGGEGGMAGEGGIGGEGGMGGEGGSDEPDPVCELPDPSELEPSNVGGGGSSFEESDHFRVFGNGNDPDVALNHLEAAHKCFVEDWCWRSPGRSRLRDDGPTYKFNVYAVGNLSGAAGVMRYDEGEGISYLEVLNGALPDPQVTIHEFGHALTLTESGWVEQTRTGAWWETVANFVADTYLTSDLCQEARDAFGVETGNTIIDLGRNISQSWRLIVDTQNYYQAWPFLTYLTNNPDDYPGIGRMALPNMFRGHMGNNDSPLHVLEDVAAPVKVQTILGRYWARMAYLDIGHPRAQERFFAERSGLDFANLDAMGGDTYRVKASKRPQYGGANIIPLDATGSAITVDVMQLGDIALTATLAIRASSGAVRYVDLPDGAGEATLADGEEASLVVVNTPNELIQYDAFETMPGYPEVEGLDYQVTIAGATPSE